MGRARCVDQPTVRETVYLAMGLDRTERYYVERIKSARDITITVDTNNGNPLSIKYVLDIRKLAHDVGIAVQDYLIKKQK